MQNAEQREIAENAFVLLKVYREADAVTRRPVVVDSTRAAWDYSDKPAIYDLDTTWAKKHSDLLDHAAYDLIRPFLAAGWREHGATVRFEEDSGFHPDRGNEVEPPAQTYWAVWQAAADQITTEALLTRAGIDPNNYLRA